MLNKLKKIKHRLEAIVSPNYTCILCNHNLKSFEPLSSFYEQNLKKYGFPYSLDDAETLNLSQYSCPHCGGSDRDRLYALFFNKTLNPDHSYRLLDIAPSSSLSSFIKGFQNIDYRSADLFMEDVDDKVDLTDMQIYADNTYDIFICSHVLEHVPDDRKAMSELYRVLKPGGWGVAMVPIIKSVLSTDEDSSVDQISERWRRFGQDDHIRLYAKNDYRKRLQEVGFKVSELTADDFSPQEFAANGIDINSVLYIVYK
jgi:SAM-dependent methyltransferase